jgi:hypothetical protein
MVFAGVLSALVAAAGALAFIGKLALAEIAGQSARYRDYKALQADAGEADRLSAAYDGIQKDLRDLRSGFPGGNPGGQVLNRLVESARACSLSIAGITALDEVAFPGYRELPFEVGLAGGFKDVVRYLHSLETGGIALQVRRMEAHSEAINKARVKARLELSVFVPGNGDVTAAAPPDASAPPPADGPR